MIRLLYLLPGLPILFGLLIFWDNYTFVGNALPAEGEVLSVRYVHDTRTNSSGRTVDDGDYYPTVRYQDQQGDWWQAETHEPVMNLEPEPGDRIAILYHRDNRGWVQQRHGWFTTWMVPLILVVVGLAGTIGVRAVLASIARADARRAAEIKE